MRSKFRLYAAVVAITLCAGLSNSHAAVTINFTAGDLYQPLGSATNNYMPSGGLLELIADTSGNGFSAPTATEFEPAGTDDVVVATFALNENFDGAGTTQNALSYDPTTFTGLSVGDPLLFRWFPSLNLASSQPGGLTAYGQFRTTTNQDGSNLPTPWAEPADGTYNLVFETIAEGGSNAEVLGEADLLTAPATPLPEPSTYAMMGLSALGLAAMKFRQRYARQS